MDKLQQQIKEFHGMLKPILKKVLEEYDKLPTSKKYNMVVKPCKQLIQKCSCKSASDMRKLSSLAYWIYIFEYKELALEICELVHNTNFAVEYEVDGIADMCGLEIRIARELFSEDRRRNISPYLLEYYFSKKVIRKLVYPKILREDEITSCSDRFIETELLYALYNLIGKGETGLYENLYENRDKIE
ncbi:MAG: hypothetical protein K2G89_04045, partial [Lachnospiraceae bacterium]|nr:hypothetical protein [Lachnospiraceae bacterium]